MKPTVTSTGRIYGKVYTSLPTTPGGGVGTIRVMDSRLFIVASTTYSAVC